jgi:hypothetical protein
MGSSCSVAIPFRGDYVGLKRNHQWRDVLTRNSLHKMDRYVVFADIVNKINRSNGKVRPRVQDLCVFTNLYH